ncbi:hypothetical protein M758_6G187500 [Ceratodon purpureus]|nr:hypothetical protein M758_6G187500 [Ceratodon purpureus]
MRLERLKSVRGVAMDSMDAALWNELPLEIVERVLSFLPVPELCRCRTVCKRWNQLICTAEFGALCAQHTMQDASFIVIHFWRNGSERISDGSLKIYSTRGWCILDLKARRWYKLYSEKQVKEGQVGCAFDYSTRFVGTDGGLLCQLLETWKTLNTADSPRPRLWNQIVVYNPIAKTLKKLPIVPGHRGHPTAPNTGTTACSKLHMVVDGVPRTSRFF